MYRWIFHKFPGPIWVRILGLAAMTATAVLLLFGFVFPWAEPFLNDPTVP